MGLDMYLDVRKFISVIDWKSVPKEGVPDGTSFSDYKSAEFLKLAEFFPESLKKYSQTGSYATLNVGYWRKAYQIHNWFVKHVQKGNDNCEPYWVSRDTLKELLTTVDKVLSGSKRTAEELLPSTSDYHDWYYDDLRHTKEMLESVLADVPESWDYDFYYNSSW